MRSGYENTVAPGSWNWKTGRHGQSSLPDPGSGHAGAELLEGRGVEARLDGTPLGGLDEDVVGRQGQATPEGGDLCRPGQHTYLSFLKHRPLPLSMHFMIQVANFFPAAMKVLASEAIPERVSIALISAKAAIFSVSGYLFGTWPPGAAAQAPSICDFWQLMTDWIWGSFWRMQPRRVGYEAPRSPTCAWRWS